MHDKNVVIMTSFCIASPHRNHLWYDYRIYLSLKREIENLGFQYRAASKNRVYLLGAPLLHFYNEVGPMKPSENNIGVIYSHPEKLDDISMFSALFACSEPVRLFLQEKFKGQVSQNLLMNIQLLPPFSSLSPSAHTKPRYQCDLSFMGTPRTRPIIEAAMPIIKKHNLSFHLFGPNWDSYEGNSLAKDYVVARNIPYEDIPLLARGSKICLIDHHQSMSKMGAVSHKYVDFIHAGAFIISDENKDAKNFYKGITYKDSSDLEEKILHYLTNQEQRQAHTLKQLLITMSQTTRASAIQLATKMNPAY